MASTCDTAETMASVIREKSYILHFTSEIMNTRHKSSDDTIVKYLDLPFINKDLSHTFQNYNIKYKQ
jgi:hypothetical protein